MTLSDLSIKNPVFAVMLAVAMMIFGYLGYRDMGISQFPEIDFPVVSITTYREAASPETMDFDVTDVIEDAVSSVEGIDYIQSQSLEGVAVTTVFFRLNRNIDVAMQDVQNAISAAMNRLPTNLDPLDVMRAMRVEHVEKPAGYLTTDRRELNVRVMGEARTPTEFEKIPIINRAGQMVYLGDIAIIEDGLSDRRAFARFNRETN